MTAPAVSVDLDRNLLLIEGCRPIHVPRSQAEIFFILARPGKVARRSELIAALWGGSGGPVDADNVLSVHVCHLRQHLQGSPVSILTHHGRGYELVLSEKVPA